MRKEYLKRFLCLLPAFILVYALAACDAPEPDEERLIKYRFESAVLQKEMTLQVYLPKAYDGTQRFPVLYFLPDYGGSDYTVIDQYDAACKADRLTDEGLISPMILVAVRMNRSFGVNSADAVETVETSSGKSFEYGPYEDYFISEILPMIDENYQTVASAEGRFIGGYSMGGFAALHLAFRHPDLFSKAGGHSPSLFVGDFTDTTVSDWLYPDAQARAARDPILLAAETELTGLTVYLDTGETDVNVEGCLALQKVLQDGDIPCELHLFPGVHSRGYCYEYMDDYLLFYGAK